MLLAIPQFFFWSYTVHSDVATVASVDMFWLRERASALIGIQPYTFARQSMLQGTFEMTQGDHVLGQAQKQSVFTRAFHVQVEGRDFHLSAVSIWRREFALYEHGIQIGRIYPKWWIGRTAIIDLPDNLSLPTQMFLFWLVVVLWRRAANSKSASH